MLVVIRLVDTGGVVVPIAAAEVVSRGNGDFLVPAAADVPGADATPTSQDR